MCRTDRAARLAGSTRLGQNAGEVTEKMMAGTEGTDPNAKQKVSFMKTRQGEHRRVTLGSGLGNMVGNSHPPKERTWGIDRLPRAMVEVSRDT